MLKWPVIFSLVMAAQTAMAEVNITPVGPPSAVYEWSKDRCEDEYIPDAPARAFRRADGQMALIATHRKNWMMLGRDFANLKRVCSSILDSTKEPSGTGSLWIEATFTRDGRNVAALVSQDLTQVVKDTGCDTRGRSGRCWLNHIIAARSEDMGATFHVLREKERLVATLTQKYDEDLSARIGVFTTSNIVEKDGAYFMIAYAQGAGNQRSGNCLFRTTDPFDPALWRAWGGTDYDINMRSPGDVAGCPGLAGLGGEVRSLSYIKRAGIWIAVFASRQKLAGDAEAVPGFYFATSKDLISWSGMSRIMAAPTRPREQNMTHIWQYPSMLDPNSASMNFDTIDDASAVLIFTVSHLKEGKGTMNRDLVYVPLRITH